jgi:hypothetical protein
VNLVTHGALNISEDALGSLPVQIMGFLHVSGNFSYYI